MQPVEFPEQNIIIAKDQPQYIQLPAHRTDDGRVISCWKLTPEEMEKLTATGVLWLSVLTFNQPLQPVLLEVEKPL